MGDTRPRPWEADEGSRSRDSKAPRLDLLAETATAAVAGVDDLLGRREEFEFPELNGGDDDDDRCCDHVPTDSAHKDILSWSLLSDDAGTCKDCSCRRRDELLPQYRRILVCLECGRHSCGDSRSYLPYGHARDHARQEQHWVAALFDDPQTGFCFKCECERPVYPEPEDELGTIAGEIQACGAGGGHAFGFDMPRDLASELLNLGDAWRAGELGSANAHGYAIRGIPNRGNTCYVNAVVQCLLALDKLRARMLGPDPPLGLLGMALRELFVEASAADSAGGLLNPDELLRCLRLHASKYEAYKMHDSYELLESLRNALQVEESGIAIENPYRERGALTVVDSIFRGKMSETRSCVYCQSASAVHGFFWELSLLLPSKEDLCKSFASSPQTSKSLKSQSKQAAIQLLSASESNSLGKIDAKSGDSHLVSELNELVMDKALDPMELDSVEEQSTWQSKDIVQNPLYAKDPLHSISLVPHSILDAKVDQMTQMTTDPPYLEDMDPPPLVALLSEYDAWMASGSNVDENGKQIIDICIPTIEDCLSLYFKEDVVELRCDCSKVPKQIEVGTNDGVVVNKGHTEQSDMTTCPNGRSSELNSLSVESNFSYYIQQDGSDAYTNTIGANSMMSCGHKEIEYHDDIQEASCSLLLNEKQTNLLSTQHSQNLIPPNPELTKQVGADISANQQRSGRANQWPRITKLPSVLTLHLKRYIKNGDEYYKNEACVSYKEHLDVGQFMDHSIVEKNNSIYRLAGVVEHRGGPFMNVGHYVAYVRARKIGNQQQQSNCSSAWFCADDSNIRETTLGEVLKCKPYVLFYERMEGKDVSGIRYDNSSK